MLLLGLGPTQVDNGLQSLGPKVISSQVLGRSSLVVCAVLHLNSLRHQSLRTGRVITRQTWISWYTKPRWGRSGLVQYVWLLSPG